MVEVLFARASILGILSADAGANFGVVNGVQSLSGAVLGEALASAEFAIPVETGRASIDASRRRADTVADLLAPVVAICAEVGCRSSRIYWRLRGRFSSTGSEGRRLARRRTGSAQCSRPNLLGRPEARKHTSNSRSHRSNCRRRQ